jgi:hypothetical protein
VRFSDVYKDFTNAQRLNVRIRFSLEINGDWKGKPQEFGAACSYSSAFKGSAGRLATQPAKRLVESVHLRGG